MASRVHLKQDLDIGHSNVTQFNHLKVSIKDLGIRSDIDATTMILLTSIILIPLGYGINRRDCLATSSSSYSSIRHHQLIDIGLAPFVFVINAIFDWLVAPK